MTRKPVKGLVQYYCEDCGYKWREECRDVFSLSEKVCIKCFEGEVIKVFVKVDDKKLTSGKFFKKLSTD